MLRDIRRLLAAATGSVLSWFRELIQSDAKGEARPAFEMTRDGFTPLAMGFTGAGAVAFKVRYIEAFNRMDAALRAQATQPRT